MNGRLANATAITKQLLCDNVRLEVASDVISGVDVERGGMNVQVKFGDFRSNRSRDIRLPQMPINNDNDTGVLWSSYKGKTPPSGVLPKNQTQPWLGFPIPINIRQRLAKIPMQT